MGSARQEGGSAGRGLGPGAQQAPRFLSGQGKHWLHSFVALPHRLPQGLPCRRWTPNRGWVPLGVGTPPLPQPPLRGAAPGFQPLLLLPFPPSHSLRTHVAGGGLGGQRIRPGISAGSWGPKWPGESWPRSLLILCPPRGSPVPHFGHGIPSPPSAALQGRRSRPTSTSPPPPLPRGPASYLVTGGSSRPLRCPWSPTSAW